ncbi:MAG: LolA family protein [Armatimonadota bacterium]
MLRRVSIALTAVAVCAAPLSAETAMEMLQQALRVTQAVEDYTAQVQVTVDAPELQIPRRTVKVYYKRPDKVHVESDGIAVLPRDALLMGNLAEHIDQFAQASFNGSGTIGERPVRCIKLSPLEPGRGSGRVLAWIDPERHLLRKSEVWRGGRAALTVRLEWTRVDDRWWLPRHIVTTLAPGALTGKDEGGRLELWFSNYRVNQGLPDSLFTEGG